MRGVGTDGRALPEELAEGERQRERERDLCWPSSPRSKHRRGAFPPAEEDPVSSVSGRA